MKLTTKVMLTGLLSLVFMFSYSQDSKNKMTKEERKAEKERLKTEKVEVANAQWTEFQHLAQKKQFVVELNKVTDIKTGKQYILSPKLNFVAMYDNKVILQFESHPFLATNGLGGVTYDGTVEEFKYSPPKKDNKPFVVSFNVIEKNYNRSTKVFISVTKDGNAIITVGNSPNFYGTFMSRGASKVFIGADMNN